MKRLQDDLGVTIFEKRGRRLGLTENGEVVLSYARRILPLNDELLDITRRAGVSGVIRIGGPQDFAAVLPEVLSHFASLYPHMQIELIDRSSFPNQDDTTQVRPYEMKGDELSWKVARRPDGSVPITILRRVGP